MFFSIYADELRWQNLFHEMLNSWFWDFTKDLFDLAHCITNGQIDCFWLAQFGILMVVDGLALGRPFCGQHCGCPWRVRSCGVDPGHEETGCTSWKSASFWRVCPTCRGHGVSCDTILSWTWKRGLQNMTFCSRCMEMKMKGFFIWVLIKSRWLLEII